MFITFIIFIVNIIFIMLNPQTQYRSRWSEDVFIFRSLSLACPTFRTRGKASRCATPCVSGFWTRYLSVAENQKSRSPQGNIREERENMRKLEKYVDEMLDTGKKPRGFTNNQAQTLIDIYYSLCNNTRTFLKDRQVFCLLRNRFHLPGKERNEGLFVVWRNDVITVVK